MRFNKNYLYGIALSLVLLILNIMYLRETRFFIAGVVICVLIGFLQPGIDFLVRERQEKEVETMFMAFVRNLVSAVKSGMPVSKAMINVAKNNYGPLDGAVKKLARQLEWSIPMHRALMNFAKETKSGVIKRAMATVIEAEESGGNLEDVLETITTSLLTIKTIRKTREASVHTQIMQSYIIFFVFLGVMIVIQNFLMPFLMGGTLAETGIGEAAGLSFLGSGGGSSLVVSVDIDTSSPGAFVYTLLKWFVSMNGVFLMLVVIQGFFAGIVVGKLAYGEMKKGVKHSVILMVIAFVVITIAQG
ncbi:type II secretion system F family protein [Candidatus Woesearchaeota archaeon]|nr:MAG: type II secretion system F family protein [Candidatus Woesearchaeota archaeon]